MKGGIKSGSSLSLLSIFRSLFSDLPNVEFFSGISDAKLLSFYQSSSCLLHVAENATANNAVLEAMACGLPIISERLGGIPEYVTAQSSILVEPGNRDAIAAAVDRLLRLAPAPVRNARGC